MNKLLKLICFLLLIPLCTEGQDRDKVASAFAQAFLDESVDIIHFTGGSFTEYDIPLVEDNVFNLKLFDSNYIWLEDGMIVSGSKLFKPNTYFFFSSGFPGFSESDNGDLRVMLKNNFWVGAFKPAFLAGKRNLPLSYQTEDFLSSTQFDGKGRLLDLIDVNNGLVCLGPNFSLFREGLSVDAIEESCKNEHYRVSKPELFLEEILALAKVVKYNEKKESINWAAFQHPLIKLIGSEFVALMEAEDEESNSEGKLPVSEEKKSVKEEEEISPF